MKNRCKHLLILFFILALLALGGVTALVVYVDPFFHYHAPLEAFPYVVDNQLSQNPGMAKNMDYDSVILGSSMTVNFETDWFKELMGLNTIKLSYSGAFPKDQSNIMKIVFDQNAKEQGRQVKKVFLGIDVITYTGDVEQTKYPIPEYLYDDCLLNDIQYVWNKDVLLNYVLRPIADPDPTDLSHVYASWWTDEYYSEEWVLRNYTEPVRVEEVTPGEEYLEPVKQNLEINIYPFIEENPDTEFVIFFPPYSILYWNDVLQENHLEATMEEYRYLCEALNQYENVRVFFFPSNEEIICDLNHYADYSHYHPKFNRYMTECFLSGEGYVAKEGEPGEHVEDYLKEMYRIIENYDFDELHDKIRQYK